MQILYAKKIYKHDGNVPQNIDTISFISLTIFFNFQITKSAYYPMLLNKIKVLMEARDMAILFIDF
jgi:hypothetical protein